ICPPSSGLQRAPRSRQHNDEPHILQVSCADVENLLKERVHAPGYESAFLEHLVDAFSNRGSRTVSASLSPSPTHARSPCRDLASQATHPAVIYMIATALSDPTIFDCVPIFKLNTVLAAQVDLLFTLLWVFLSGGLSLRLTVPKDTIPNRDWSTVRIKLRVRSPRYGPLALVSHLLNLDELLKHASTYHENLHFLPRSTTRSSPAQAASYPGAAFLERIVNAISKAGQSYPSSASPHDLLTRLPHRAETWLTTYKLTHISLLDRASHATQSARLTR
ncbi:hypothetical protein EDB84DRAFT_1639835, partial [Lactarius hengduanensis]